MLIGHQLHDFNVGISDVSPLVMSPIPSSYTLCGHVTGIAGAQVNVTCDNNSQERHVGRYVILQIITQTAAMGDYLTPCEVSVFAGKIAALRP